jgi:hypothetical protein
LHKLILKYSKSAFIISGISGCLNLFPLHLNAQGKSAVRYEIDAKRIGVYPTDKDALPRSREFIRLDSTYYVGWLYEGLYKYERSADYLGYKYAIVPLYKALTLLEKDYGDNLRKIYTSMNYFTQYANRYDDFYRIASTLQLAYNSIEMPDSAMALLDKIESYNFQRDFFNINSDRAWLYHRFRFFTHDQHGFLGNSIAENEKLAYNACYKQITFIKKNKNVNDYWYGPRQSDDDILVVDHYLAILHNYNANYDSAEYYYKKLIDGNRVSWGNYANFQHEIGNFEAAVEYYSRSYYRRKFALSEQDYYLPSLYIYCARTKDAIGLAQAKIEESGSTPGFGWYNIALARSYLYDGQLDSCDFFLTKAFNFKELHINTTLTQSQYEFTINLLRIQLLDKQIQQVKFFNKGWWYSFTDLYEMLSFKLEKLMLEYAVVNALAYNPERKRVIYDLFNGESTITFDETAYLLKDFSLPYFEKMYQELQTSDKRKKIHKYYRLLSAKFKYEDGDEEGAAKDCQKLLEDVFAPAPEGSNNENTVSKNYEKLFLARAYELLAKCGENQGLNSDSQKAQYFEEFPQLIPFSGINMKLKLTSSGVDDELIKKVMSDMSGCNIDITTESNINTPEAFIQFDKKGEFYQAIINVTSGSGKSVVTNGQIVFKTADGIGKELALRLFGKGGAIKYETAKDVAVKTPVK